MPKIRTTIQPGNVIDVSESEFLDLDRQGLVLEIVHKPAGPIRTETVRTQVVSTADRKTQ